jgi:di/tripeptidase
MPDEMAQSELDGPIETVDANHAAKRALGKALGTVEENTTDRNGPAKNGASKADSHETARLVKDLLEGDRKRVASSKKEMQKAIDELRHSVTAPSSQDGVESEQQDQPQQQGQDSVEAIIKEALNGSSPGP